MARREQIFCAFCRIPSRIYRTRSLGFRGLVGLTILSLSLGCLMFSGWLGRWPIWWTAGSIFLILLTEIVVHLRWRTSVICRQCGFDPILYKKSPAQAAAQVKQRLENRKKDPRALLARPLNLPRLRKSGLGESSETGRLNLETPP
ncbi:MAG: hypothetical protein WCH11_07330 [Bdellovibrio sp.]